MVKAELDLLRLVLVFSLLVFMGKFKSSDVIVVKYISKT